jgi:hypothetical protein
MSIPALPVGADTRAVTDRLNVLIRAFNAEVPVAAAIGAGVLALDLRAGRAFQATVDGDLAQLAIANATAGQLNVVLLELAGNGTAYAQAWPGLTWLTGTPVLSSDAGKRDLVGLLSLDGSAWLAVMIGQYY